MPPPCSRRPLRRSAGRRCAAVSAAAAPPPRLPPARARRHCAAELIVVIAPTRHRSAAASAAAAIAAAATRSRVRRQAATSAAERDGGVTAADTRSQPQHVRPRRARVRHAARLTPPPRPRRDYGLYLRGGLHATGRRPPPLSSATGRNWTRRLLPPRPRRGAAWLSAAGRGVLVIFGKDAASTQPCPRRDAGASISTTATGQRPLPPPARARLHHPYPRQDHGLPPPSTAN